MALPTTTRVSATVIEWDSNGEAIIQEGSSDKRSNSPAGISTKAFPQVRAPNSPADLERALNQKVTREVALKFSGDDGVVAAGLTALEFVDLFEALIRRESAFDHKAVSEKGAQGLGQLMPETAKDLHVKEPFDAYENLTASARYFTALLKEFGQADLALAAYNAGPSRVKERGRVPRIEETQNYVRTVLTNAGQPVPEMVAAGKSASKEAEPPKGSEPPETPVKATAGEPLTGELSVWEF
ncbi:lytic transglycosylase domain-containing protein [Roseibium suaedae]|uniref:lytic transglycosylase domain-containing protein n=1 Tax=Roseibium suaedae TaxID=735517 RepID=UPI0015881370|nr:lytic transglycosylase domain-containing protein [Roseibium suaedae]